MIPSEWAETPPSDIPFYPCWVTNGEYVFLATWRNDDGRCGGRWEIGKGLAFTPDEITHYQVLKAPKPPKLIQEKSAI